MSTWTTSQGDAMLKVGDAYVRTSRVESIRYEGDGKVYTDGDVRFEVTITLIGGKQFKTISVDPEAIAAKVMGHRD